MTKAEVILKAIKNGATDAELATLEATPEDQFNNEEVGKPSGTATRANAVVVPVSTDLEQEGISSELASLNIDDKTLALDGVKKDVVVEKDNKPKYLDFNQWYTNDDGETSMVEKLEKLHPDYDITEAVIGDDVVSIKRKGDKEGIEVRLQTKWTDNADHSAGYRKYLDYVGGEDVDKTLNDYHDKTIGKYKQVGKDGKAESDEAFFKRTLPKFGVISSQNEYSSTEESYSEISGVRKTSSGVYVKASGGKASKEEKEMYEQMSFLHDLKKRSDKTREGTLSQEFENESNIVLQSQLGDKKSDKNLTKDVGDKTTFTAADYGSFVKDEAYEDFQEKALEIYAAEKVRGNEELQVAIDAFLPRARVETTQHFQPQYTALKAEQDEIIAKGMPGAKKQTTKHFQPRYDALEREQKAIVEKVSPSVIAQYQKEINAGLWDHKSQEELNAELNRRINGYLSGMQEKYDKVNGEANTYLNDLLNNSLGGMQAKYDKVNEEANAYLNKIYQKEQEDPESDFGKVINKITNNADNAIKAIQQEFFNTWKPEPNLISEAKYEEISQVLDKGGFANLNTNDKKLALTKQWNLLSDQLDDYMTKEQLAEAEKEFWSVNYSKLDKDKNGGFSQFLMKGVAQDQLGIINDAINLEIEKIRPSYKESPLRTAKEEDKYIRRLAIESLGKKDPSFKNYNQVERYLDKIINSPETMSNSGMVNFWRGLTSKQGHEYLPFVSGIISTGDSYTIKKITDKDPKDRTEEEKTLISIMAMKNETGAKVEEMSNSYNAGGMTADMLPFMGEMMATSGLAGVVGKATTTASRAFLFPKALQLSGQTAVNVAEGASKTFGYLMGNLARTVVSPQRFMDQTYQNMTSEMGLMLSDEGTGLVAMVDENTGQDWEPAFARAFGSTWTEYISEGLGEKLPGLSKYVRRRVFGDPEWMKRIALGRYMRKIGLEKSEVATHFLTKKVGYNGVFGEIAEEIINTPMQNLINGQDFGAGMDDDFYKELAISMSATGFVFSSGSIGYNAMKGNKQSSYFVDHKRYNTRAEQKKEVERMRDAGLLTANTDIEINNDWAAYDEISEITDSFGFEGLVKSVSGTSKAIQDKIAATELEVADQIKRNTTPEQSAKIMKELEALELQLEQQEQQKDLVAFDENIPEEIRVQEVTKLQQRIENNRARRKAIVDPYIKRIEAKKALPIFKENLKNVQKRAEQLYGKEMPVVEVESTAQAVEELEIEFATEIAELENQLEFRMQGTQGVVQSEANRKGNEQILSQIKELEKERDDLVKGFDGTYGFITPEKGKGQRIIINKNFALSKGAINVAGHEFFHRILQTTMRQNPETAIALGGALESVLKNLDPKQFRDSKLRARLRGYQVSEASMRKWDELEAIENELGKESQQWKSANTALQGSRVQDAMVAGEETLTLLSDALASGDLQYNETVFTRIGDAIRRVLSAMGIRASFNNGRDVFNFIKDYNKTMASGKAFDKGMLKTIKRGAKIGGKLKESAADMKEQVEDLAPGARGIYFSKDEATKEQDVEALAIDPNTVDGGMQFYRDKVKEYEREGMSTEKAKIQAFRDYSEAGERHTNESWMDGIGDVYESLMYGDMLNGMMRNTGAKLQGDNVFNFPISEFFTELKQQLDTAIMGFKPSDNNNFSGWIGFHVSKKKPGVLDKFKKRSEEKKADASPTLAPSVAEVTGGIVVASRFGEVVAATGKTTVEASVDKIVNANFRTHKDPQKYKEVKQALVSVEKIKDPKTGKMKSPSKVEDVVPTGPLYPVLQVFAKEFGVDPRKILGNIALTKTERRNAQQALNKLGVETTLKLFPEGFTESGDATGMPTSILNAINPETGEPNLIYTKIGRKQNLDLQKKNNIKSINIAAAANVFGITQMGEMNRFDTDNRLVDGPLRTVITQLATLAGVQSAIQQAEADGNFNRFAGIKDGKSSFAFSMDTLSDLDIDRRLEFLNKIDGVLGVLKPGFGKDVKVPIIVDELKKAHGDLFTEKEYKKIAAEMEYLFDRYQPRVFDPTNVMSSLALKEESWSEMLADMKEDPLDNFFKFLGIDSKATVVFDSEVNINKQRQSIPALGNYLKSEGLSMAEIAEIMVVLQPAYSGNTQISRKKNFIVDKNGYAVKVSDEIKAKKMVIVDGVKVNVGGDMSSPRNQSFESIGDFIQWGVLGVDGMTLEVWEAAKKKVKLRKQDAGKALKDIGSDGIVSEEFKNNMEIDAELGRTALDYMMDFLISSPNHGHLDIGMFLVSNLSHMEAPIRRSAMFTDVVEGLTDPKHPNYVAPKNRNKSTVVYEHSIPANEMAYRLAYYKLNNQWDNNFWDKYTVAVITKEMDDVLKDNGLQSRSNPGFRFADPLSSQYDRYYGPLNYGEEAILPIKNIFTGGITAPLPLVAGYKMSKDVSKAILNARTPSEARGITVLDFDDTLATSKSLIRFTRPDGTKGTLNAEEYAKTYQELTDLGYEWDFSEFNEVVDGKVAPLFNKAMKLQGKFSPKDMFVLTARPAEAAPAIFAFLQANGLNIPLENITGLGNSTGKAKADWIAGKVGEGYNDFYFADDAVQNVEAVQDILNQLDVKSKVQLAKVKFSKELSPKLNDMLEQTSGIASQKVFSDAQAKIRGAKARYGNLIPASAQDFSGLLYNFIGKGKQGEADMAFFKKALIDPFARGINEINASKQSAASDYKNLQKAFPEVKKIINENIEGTRFTNDQAARVYLWDKAGFEVPGLSKRDLKTLLAHVESNPSLKAYANGIGLISKKEKGYSAPGDYWLAENITSDLLSDDATNGTRADFLAEWQQNADAMFTPENLNKIEAIYGSKFREALEDVLYRMKTGRNRPSGGGRLVNQYMNWVNNSVGAIMFLNMRSAALQTISATNYMNWSDNNPAKAALAFANQKQFWKDFSMIFNSDYLKQRRSGNQRGINEAELSAAVAGAENKAKAALSWLLKKGFLPTQMADSFAISMGGASFYRNRTNKYIKEGMTQELAEKQAFLDLQETTEVNQQSARPDMISQQQASPLGRLILAFQNTPMQYARIMDKAGRDIINGRGDFKHNVSKIVYYGFAQSILFGALQSAIFASMGDDEEEDFDKKKERIINGMIDSALSGGGVGGKAIATTKNTIREFLKQRDRGFKADHAYTLLQALSFSPPIGSKLRKIYSSIQTDKFNKDVFLRRGFTLDNPIWGGVGNVIEGVTNAPLGRISNMMLQLDNVLDSRNETWKRLALAFGWNTWDLGIKDLDIEALKEELKEEKKVETKKKQKIKKQEKKKEKEEANVAVIEENKKKSKKDGVCSAISKGGTRCKTKVVEGDSFCTIHEKAPTNSTGVKSQCKKIKDGGKQCGMQTASKSGLCYYHD